MILKFRVVEHASGYKYIDAAPRIVLRVDGADAINSTFTLPVCSLADYPLDHEFEMQTVTPETASAALNASWKEDR